ncbi:MAG TPA: hypothetical protein DDY31_08155 [Lachnospiraceae bacterium]|nr:hypothetical protein [Lachnospiraceae bacterium]
MYDTDTLLQMKSADIRDIDRDTLACYETLMQITGETRGERIKKYIETSGSNPYFYKDMGYVVKSVPSSGSDLSFIDCTKRLVAKRAGMAM